MSRSRVPPPPPPLPDAQELSIAQDFADGIVEVLGAFGGGGAVDAQIKPTFTWVTRQNAGAGTLLSRLITVSCFLVRVAASASITVAKQAVTYPANGSQFSDQFIALIPPTSLQPWVGRAQLNPNDIIYVDSLGGLGTADSFVMTFQLA